MQMDHHEASYLQNTWTVAVKITLSFQNLFFLIYPGICCLGFAGNFVCWEFLEFSILLLRLFYITDE